MEPDRTTDKSAPGQAPSSPNGWRPASETETAGGSSSAATAPIDDVLRHLEILRAVDRAVFDSACDGWATAREVRIAFDGCPNPQGIWARKLWSAESAGLLEARPYAGHPGSMLWGLTTDGWNLVAEADRG